MFGFPPTVLGTFPVEFGVQVLGFPPTLVGLFPVFPGPQVLGFPPKLVGLYVPGVVPGPPYTVGC